MVTICMKLFLTVLLAIPIITLAQGQGFDTDDPIQYAAPGIYLSFENFITNSPIDPETIVTDQNPYGAGFYLQLFKEKTIEYVMGSTSEKFRSDGIWGYCDGRSIWINREVFPAGFFTPSDVTEHPFAKISFPGELSLVHFVRNHAPQANQWGGVSSGSSKPLEFILDTRDGKIHKATLKNLERLIENDPDLLNEFRKQKKDIDIKLYVFLRKYNQKYPFEFR